MEEERIVRAVEAVSHIEGEVKAERVPEVNERMWKFYIPGGDMAIYALDAGNGYYRVLAAFSTKENQEEVYALLRTLIE